MCNRVKRLKPKCSVKKNYQRNRPTTKSPDKNSDDNCDNQDKNDAPSYYSLSPFSFLKK